MLRPDLRPLCSLLLLSLLSVGGCRDRGATDADPVRTAVLRELATAYFAEERYDEAREAMEEVLESGAASAQDYVNAACVDIAQQSFEPAEREARWARADERLDRALEIDSDLAPAWYCRGVLRLRHIDFKEAERCFRAALESVPDDPASRLQLAATLTDLDRRDEAEVELLKVIDLGVEFGGSFYASALHRLYQHHVRSGDPEKIAQAPALQAEKAELKENGVDAPNQEQLDRGILGRVSIPAPVARAGSPASATPTFEAMPLDLFGGLGEISELVAWDVDGDGDEDLLAVGDGGAAVALQGDGRAYTEQTLAAGAWRRVVPTDLDDDGLASVLLVGDEPTALLTLVEGAWRDDSATLPEAARSGVRDAVFVDYEHEGDLDLLVATDAGLRLFRNLGAVWPAPVPFEDATAAAGMPDGAFDWIVLLDHDHDQDVDFLVGGAESDTLIVSNLRKGRFELRRGAATGLPSSVPAALRGDLDHDGKSDLVLAGAPATFWRNDGDGTFSAGGPIKAIWERGPATLRDVDRNGELDLVTGAPGGGKVAFGFGSLLVEPWLELGLPGDVPPAGRPLIEDLDGDGDLDAVLLSADGGVVLQRQTGAPPTNVVRLSLEGKKDNRPAIGAIVEMRAGALYTHVFVERPRLTLGLADMTQPDVLRVTWPNGVVQYAIRPPPGEPIDLIQKSGLTGSCPFLYTWNGSTWEFIGDVLGATPLGLPMADGVYVPPDHDELVRIEGRQLAPKDGEYLLTVTEELREATYLDRAALWVVDHAPDVEIHPEERFCFPPFPAPTIHAVQGAVPVVRAIGSDGRDWTEALARRDGEHAIPFEPAPPQFQGLATPHSLELTLPESVRDAARVRLLMTGWFYWTDASVNIAAAQHAEIEFVPPTLSVPDGDGGWRVTGPPIGFPTGKTKTMVFDVGDLLNRDDPRLRIDSTLRLYWDCIRVAVDDGDHPFTVTKLEAATADLRYRGFSARLPRLRSQDPEWFTYSRTMPAPWNQHRGMLTRYGDVVPLLQALDDRFAIFSAGDEIVLRFPVGATAPREGDGRTYLLFLDGWAKDDDPNSAFGGLVLPLPFHGMSGYPYGEGEAYPDGPEEREYLRTWNTRPGRRLQEDLTNPAAR